MTTIGNLETRIEKLEQAINDRDVDAESEPEAVDRAILAAIREARGGEAKTDFAEVVVDDVRAAIFADDGQFVVEAESKEDGEHLRTANLSKEAVRLIALADAMGR